MKVVRIFNIGASTAVLLPPSVIKTMRWKSRDYLVMEIFENDLILSKLEFPPHIIKRISEKRQRVYESLQEVK